MGSSKTFFWQCALFVLGAGVLVVLAPAEARLWVSVTGCLALAFFMGVSLVRHRQIKQLALEIDEVLHNGRNVSFSSYREGDVAVLSNELQKMVARLSLTTKQLQDERNALATSLADISHQIRTPLTAVSLMLPQIERADDAVVRKRAIRKLEAMIDRVSWLVTTLLKIAKIDAGALRVEHKPVACDAAVWHALSPLETALEVRGIQLELEFDGDATFTGDELWSAEAIENIVKNCMEFTPSGGTIAISAREDVLATTIDIVDSGSGISAEDLPHIFERFYRGSAHDGSMRDGETAAGVSGFGIGLALAQALISAQGGTVRASNVPTGGAHFQIAFPKLVV